VKTNEVSGAQPVSIKALRFPLIAITILVLALGALEDWYAPTSVGDLYGSDAVSFLDVSRAIQRGDWRSALNPLWSQGYPALLAIARPIFKPGPVGDWWAIRTLNLVIFGFCYVCFAFLIVTCLGRLDPEKKGFSARTWTMVLASGVCIFIGAQLCLDQASRVGPDQLVAALIFLACALLLKLLNEISWSRSIVLGAVLGAGFIVKAVLLPMGCLLLAIFAVALLVKRKSPLRLVPAGMVFLAFIASYGVALSHAVGHFTLGESGSLNYSWHVDRLQKWVHWEGGALPGDQAWPKAWMVRFAHWDTNPPDFGKPIHPSVILHENPRVYGFSAPIHATYVPYFDPPYWYEGHRQVFNPRYQAIALAKSLVDLSTVLARQPETWVFLAIALIALWRSRERETVLRVVREFWPLLAVAVLCIATYLPVHLEGRYLAALLALLAWVLLLGVAAAFDGFDRRRQSAIVCLLGISLMAELAMPQQRKILSRIAHHWSYQRNDVWQRAMAIRNSGLLPPGTRVGVMTGGPSIPCDWAYIAELQIVQFSSRRNCVSFVSSSIRHQFDAQQISTKSSICSIVSAWLKPVWCAPPA
jgi:hypothetical protein